MKTEPTEPTEALELKKSIQYGLGIIDAGSGILSELSSMVEDVVNIAFSEGQSSPKIKQLEWTDHLRHYFVDTPFGVYLILRNHNFEENESWTLYFNSYVIDGCIDSDKAQEVAQADFERRVMGCLDL